MEWLSLQQEEQQELWNTLEVVMHGKTSSEARCAQQRLEKMQTRLLPHLAPAAQKLLANLFRAAVCASNGGEQRFYWLTQVEQYWRTFSQTLEACGHGSRRSGNRRSGGRHPGDNDSEGVRREKALTN